ncbi:15139_t:CDS:2 [Dentiscutata heterogama]|uniref:15139_t:CDS:1 n=1 Tax=Dentiscutata heterogama TaxID=1316150 RepID=A0ACA9JWY8_9GLOM|nr:15139_t:CDS:2 [Dentiscutata heterogama]
MPSKLFELEPRSFTHHAKRDEEFTGSVTSFEVSVGARGNQKYGQ